MVVHKVFSEMKAEEKIDFFVYCQKLLVEFHPDSPFICRRNNTKSRIQQMKGFIENYKGLCYQDDNIGVLYNRIVITDPSDPILALKTNMYKASHPDYNAVSIDFVVFRDLKDCMAFVKTNYDPRIQHVLFVKNNKVKIYPIVNFLTQMFHIPVV